MGGAPLHRHFGQRVCDRGAARELRPLESFRAHEKILGREEKLRRRKQRPGGISPQQLVAALSVVPEFRESAMHLSVHAHGGALRQVVEERRGLLEKERQVVLDPGGRGAVAPGLLNGAPPWGAPQTGAETGAGIGSPRPLPREISRREQAGFSGPLKRWPGGPGPRAA